MKLKELKSQLVFNRSQRVGILLLLAIIIGCMYVQFFVFPAEESNFTLSSAEVQSLEQQMDSLRRQDSLLKLPKRYLFNPNFLTDYKAYTLGIAPDEFDRLQAFRRNNQWVNTAAQFQKVTGVSDSLLQAIHPYFKFPDWVTQRQSRKIQQPKNRTWTDSEKKELNTATAEELQVVHGIGKVLSARIVAFREKLGGFHHEDQLHAVWGLPDSVVDQLKRQFKLETPVAIKRYNVNEVSASDLSTIPGISFELGKKIWEFVQVRDGVLDLAELQKIEGVSPSKLKGFRLYLYAE